MKCNKCGNDMKIDNSILDKKLDVLLIVNIYKCSCGNTDIDIKEYDD